MIKVGSMNFHEIWVVDFEFNVTNGNRQLPVCMVAYELHSKHKLRIWQDELNYLSSPPYSIGHNSLFVAYYASAEFGCHLSLGWSLPKNVLDLFTEFRNLTNGYKLPCGNTLLGALAWFGLSSIEAAEKDLMRDLILQGGPWSSEETEKILDYCESDVMSLKRLLRAMESKLDMPRALLRGRYMKAASQMEYTGIPIDTKMLSILKNNWDQIRHRLIQDTDTQYGIFENLTFKEERFANWLNTNKIPWPKLNSGKLDLKDETFKEMSLRHTQIQPLRDLRFALSQLRLSDLAIGQDGRNRCILSAFRARTSRNQPSNSRFIFGPAVWLRNLIKPDSGNGLAYIDWSQQEFGIAAVLSQDPNMIEAYESGDPYMAFGIQAGAVPPDAIKETHGWERDQFKACVLAVQYGMGEKSLAKKINQPISQARKLLMLHRQTYHKFWRWSDSVVDYAMLYGKLWTTFGWTIHINSNPNPRFLRNFPMQANGAEMLRIACCKAVEQGIRICAPIHDALLIEAPLNELEYAVKAAQRAMSEASSAVLSGYELRTNVEIIRHPQRYSDERGALMWERLQKIVSELKNPKFLTLCPHLKI